MEKIKKKDHALYFKISRSLKLIQITAPLLGIDPMSASDFARNIRVVVAMIRFIARLLIQEICILSISAVKKWFRALNNFELTYRFSTFLTFTPP